MASVPFWEESYKDDKISAFGTKPNPEVKEFIELFQKSWNVLEAGCGEAKNSIYLASNGFKRVNAFDISENAIAKVKKIAAKNEVELNSFTQDLCTFPWKENYDLVISYGTLHFVPKEGWHHFIQEAKEHTNVGGIHIIQIFTNKVPASPDIEEFAFGLADEGELQEFYQGWKILSLKAFVLEDEHPGAPKHYHAINKIVAQKL